MSRIASRGCQSLCIFPEPEPFSLPPLCSIHSPHGHYRGVSPSKAVCSFVRLIFHSRWERERRPKCRRFPCAALRLRARVIQSSIDSYGCSSGPQANDRGEFVLYRESVWELHGETEGTFWLKEEMSTRKLDGNGMEVMGMGGQDHPNGTYLLLFSA